jgi:NO-binding membrane sensor protein with MHYT domain
VILGRPVSPHLASAAADHGRQLRAYPWVGGIWALVGVAMLAANAFGPHSTGWSWLITGVALVNAAVFSFYGFNARRAARLATGAEQRPR